MVRIRLMAESPSWWNKSLRGDAGLIEAGKSGPVNLQNDGRVRLRQGLAKRNGWLPGNRFGYLAQTRKRLRSSVVASGVCRFVTGGDSYPVLVFPGIAGGTAQQNRSLDQL